MKFRYFYIYILLLLAYPANAQPAEEIYSGTPIIAGYKDDGGYGPFNIGFSFTYFGNTYTQFYVHTNGLVSFGSISDFGAEESIPTAVHNNFIAAFWDDLNVDGTGKISYTTIGAAPHRKLIIQFNNMGLRPFPPMMGSFSVVLYETSDIIRVQYRLIADYTSTRAHGESATIGIENSTGTAGVQYAYHSSSAVATGKAITFTPSGPTYTLDADAMYEGIYLTSNLTLPEPGIPSLLSPPQNAVIGSGYTFSWSDAGNTASYTLLISTSSDLGGATQYPCGSNTSKDVTGLAIGQTYYWGVTANNTTGTTWCENKKFTTSATPPMEAVPQTLWVGQNQNRTIKLNYTGGDASAKTAIITTLPSQGQLYQYNGGAKGPAISIVPATITDPGRNVIYTASGSAGNGAGNFIFKIHDAGGDSPEATVTMNVSPPGIPDVLGVAKSNGVEIRFDLPMADPAGKQDQFAVKVDAVPAVISSACLKPGDSTTIVLVLATPLTGPETVLVSYTMGTVSGLTGGLLLSFTDQSVNLSAQTITFPDIPLKHYGDPAFPPGATSSSGLSITYSSSNQTVATSSGSNVTIISAGTAEITARQAGNGTYAPANETRTLEVAKADQTITFGALPSKTYGAADYTLTATASSGLSVSFSGDNNSVATVTGNLVHIVGAGSVVITASQAGNSNYNPAPDVQQTLTVNKADQTITFSALPDKTYGDSDFTLTASSGSGLSVGFSGDNNSVATVTGDLVHIVGAGSVVITASQPGNTNYNAAPDVHQTLNVNKADQTITFGVLPGKTYGDADFTLSASASSGLSVNFASDNPAVASVTGNIVHVASAGTATITASQPGNDNYNAAISATQVLIVGKANLTFKADNKSKIYLSTNPVLTFVTSGFVNGDTQVDAQPSIQTTASADSPAGDYPITISGGSDHNYNFLFVPGTLTITKIQQTITFSDYPVRLLAGDVYTLKASSTSGLPVLFESSDNTIATISFDQMSGVSKGNAEIRAYNAGDDNFAPSEAFVTVEIYSTHKDIMHLFTPNNDGINDYWELPEMATWGNCDVKVYSRNGKLVFSDPNYNNLWDGTSNGNPLPEGAYYFIIKTQNAGMVKGVVNIVR